MSWLMVIVVLVVWIYTERLIKSLKSLERKDG
jgi:hypothetical protein